MQHQQQQRIASFGHVSQRSHLATRINPNLEEEEREELGGGGWRRRKRRKTEEKEDGRGGRMRGEVRGMRNEKGGMKKDGEDEIMLRRGGIRDKNDGE